jgi:hypothetical protein
MTQAAAAAAAASLEGQCGREAIRQAKVRLEEAEHQCNEAWGSAGIEYSELGGSPLSKSGSQVSLSGSQAGFGNLASVVGGSLAVDFLKRSKTAAPASTPTHTATATAHPTGGLPNEFPQF